MTTFEALSYMRGVREIIRREVPWEKMTDACDMAIEALETSDKAVERAINKIASELKHWMHCSGCPVNCVWGTDIKMCDELLAEWMKGIIEE